MADYDLIGNWADDDIVYVGWIRGMPWDRWFLSRLGVQGRMSLKWEPMTGPPGFVFTHCEASGEVVGKLSKTRLASSLGSFSRVRAPAPCACEPCACSCSG